MALTREGFGIITHILLILYVYRANAGASICGDFGPFVILHKELGLLSRLVKSSLAPLESLRLELRSFPQKGGVKIPTLCALLFVTIVFFHGVQRRCRLDSFLGKVLRQRGISKICIDFLFLSS